MRLIALLFALALSVLPATAQEGGVAATPDVLPGSGDGLRLLAEVERRFPRSLALIKQEFPDDYPGLVASISAVSWQGGEEKVALLKAFELLKAQRQKYRDKAVFAPSNLQAASLQILAHLFQEVFKAEGSQVCGRFAQDGSAVLFDLGISDKYTELLDLQATAYLAMVVKGIEEPDYAGELKPEDWGQVLGAMVTSGMPKSYVQTISKGDRNDPDLCPAMASMMLASALLNTPEGARTRADFARNLAGY